MTTEQLAEELLTLWRLLRNLSHPVRRAEITPEQYWLLRLLSRAGPLNISELAAKLGIATSSATAACKRLEKAGLLTRERQSDDERVVRVVLTAQGNAKITAWSERKRAALAHMLSVLDPLEQQEFQRMLERVLEAAGAREFAEERLPGEP
jgi:DNA-binding MarR family transcriptional regulator